MTPALTPALLAQLGQWTATTFGLRFDVERWPDLTRGLIAAARELEVEDFSGWAARLAAGDCSPDQVAVVATHLTISETYFFRHPDHFARLERDILPERLAARADSHQGLRVWSAGCATGEEPYSIAVLLHRRFGPAVLGHAHLVGTDLSRRVIARAKSAKYSHWSFRDAPEWLQATYFTPAGHGRVQLIPEIRQRVSFRVLNLAAPLLPAEFGPGSNFDVILCRNVLMYLSPSHQQAVLQRFAQALAAGGWLLTGPCDISRDAAAELGLTADAPGLFRKRITTRGLVDDAGFILSPATHPITPIAPAPASVPPASAATAGPAPELASPPSPPPLVTLPATTSPADEAQALANRGELAAALAACDTALASDRANAELYYLRGCILQEQDQLAAAEQAFRSALYLEPANAAVLFALGCVQERLGRREHARHHFGLLLAALADRRAGEPLAGANGLTVGRMHALVRSHLDGPASA